MRDDLKKVVVERPRLGSGEPSPKTRLHIKFPKLDADDIDFPTRVQTRRLLSEQGIERKRFNEHLNPLKKYLHSCIGQHWDKVFSEISQKCDANGTLGHHIIHDHLHQFIIYNTRMDENGHIWGNIYGVPKRLSPPERYFHYRYRTNGILYVHPTTKIISIVKNKKIEQKEQDYDCIKISEEISYEKHNGCWFEVKYKKDLGNDLVWVTRKDWVKVDGKYQLVDKPVQIPRNRRPGFNPYIYVGKRSLNHKEIKNLPKLGGTKMKFNQALGQYRPI